MSLCRSHYCRVRTAEVRKEGRADHRSRYGSVAICQAMSGPWTFGESLRAQGTFGERWPCLGRDLK